MMILWKAVFSLVGILGVCSEDSEEHQNWCDSVCPTPKPDPSSASCAPPCPALPEIPPCPTPHCPAPVVNLTCPEPRCPSTPPPVSCPTCPTCAPPPPVPTCPTCPTCSSPSVKVSPKSAPEGYTDIPGAGMYKVFSNELTWLEANRTCSRDGGYLAIPRNPGQLSALLSILRSTETFSAFIGLHNFFHDGYYRNALGQPMNDFQQSLWAPGEPKRGPGINAIALESFGTISDLHDSFTQPFICELPVA